MFLSFLLYQSINEAPSRCKMPSYQSSRLLYWFNLGLARASKLLPSPDGDGMARVQGTPRAATMRENFMMIGRFCVLMCVVWCWIENLGVMAGKD
jgi:hypothetical protein